jgi:GNAT superfamily N-acetyltransferase
MGSVTPPRPLEAGDDRESFDCGKDSLNTWLRRHAWRNHVAGMSRVSVICDAEAGALAGLVALSTGSIRRGAVAKRDQRNASDPIPVILLGQLAVDRRWQGQGHARSLLGYALRAALAASQSIGAFAVIAHPVDDNARAFYRRWGFADLPDGSGSTMVVRVKDIAAAGY